MQTLPFLKRWAAELPKQLRLLPFWSPWPRAWRPRYTRAFKAPKRHHAVGQQVWFLGYPFGDTALTTRMENQILPFIKRGTISAINGSKPDAIILYIDGFNNPGFSGGPIVYWAFGSHTYRILGVVQGYKVENAKMMVNGQPADTQVLVNSGILIGYSIAHAIQAID